MSQEVPYNTSMCKRKIEITYQIGEHGRSTSSPGVYWNNDKKGEIQQAYQDFINSFRKLVDFQKGESGKIIFGRAELEIIIATPDEMGKIDPMPLDWIAPH